MPESAQNLINGGPNGEINHWVGTPLDDILLEMPEDDLEDPFEYLPDPSEFSPSSRAPSPEGTEFSEPPSSSAPPSDSEEWPTTSEAPSEDLESEEPNPEEPEPEEPESSPPKYGRFRVQEDCVADHNGTRHTITFHHTLPHDDLFNATPRAETAFRPKSDPPERYPIPDSCDRCHSCRRSVYFQSPVVKNQLTAEYNALMAEYERDGLHGLRPEVAVNRLAIEGYTYAFNRGKEVNLYIANKVAHTYWLIRVHFHTEGHTFGCPTSMYETITAQPPVSRGEKGKAFIVPAQYHPEGLEDREMLVSIIAAIVCSRRTMLFVDHNCLIAFHMSRLRRPLTADDFRPGSPVYKRLWGLSHGPVFTQEVEETLRALTFWRRAERKKQHNPKRTIFMALTQAQHACNGFGAQEGSDALLWAFIVPMQPAREVFEDDTLWRNLCQALHDRAVATYVERTGSQKLRRVSNDRPFYFNEDAHNRYMPNILCYKRDHFDADRDWLERALALGIIKRSFKMRANGTATAPDPVKDKNFKPIARAMPDQPTEVGAKNKTVRVLMYAVKIGGKRHWTPFIAAPGDNWATYEEVFHPNFDISAVKRDSTLGPYSFVTFCQAAYAHRESEEPIKRRPGRPRKNKHSKLYKQLYVKNSKEVMLEEEEDNDRAVCETDEEFEPQQSDDEDGEETDEEFSRLESEIVTPATKGAPAAKKAKLNTGVARATKAATKAAAKGKGKGKGTRR
ncbi:hypothetical protein BD626DRAFT_541773 [Schizophyllum amplum]|uniref:Uncharacterized protein n=1 Tax=Schizophyllum amplum TaxID=97359 RepID=A0A550BTH5_9AGAR|nr:hypothetical protein BD626DRAFT_541773 [Auriculariopsis ampla]